MDEIGSTPELRLLTLCLPDAPGSHANLTAHFASIEWPVLVEAARWHGILPLLAARLLAPVNRTSLPPAVLAEVRGHQERHLFRTLTQTAALVELQRAFDRAGLTILPWKGISLGLLLYGSPTLRDAADLDFLFLEKDIPAVLEIARRLEYRLREATDDASKDIYIMSLHREFTFSRKRDQIVLEFHLQFLPAKYALWQDSQADVARASTRCPLGDVQLPMQHPEDLLVSLCAHAGKHDWDRMKWSCDIAQFLRVYGEKVEWVPFLVRLGMTRKDGVVLLGVALAVDLFGLPRPDGVEAALGRRPAIVTLARSLAAHMLSGTTGMVGAGERNAMLKLLCPRLRDRLAYRLRPMLDLNYEDLAIPVGRRLFFLNYGSRVLRLLRKYGAHRLARKTAASVRSVD